MKNKLIIFFGIILGVILEISFVSSIFSANSAPNLILIVLISSVIIFGFSKVWPWSLVAGFIFDIFYYNRIGISIIGFIFICYAVSFSSKRLILGEKIGGALIGFFFVSFSTFSYNLWILWSDSGFSFEILWAAKYYLLGNIGWKIIFNSIIFIFSLLILKHWENKNSVAKRLI